MSTNLHVLEHSHPRHRSARRKRKIRHVNFRLGQRREDGTLAGVGRADQHYLAGSASRHVEYVHVRAAALLLRAGVL